MNFKKNRVLTAAVSLALCFTVVPTVNWYKEDNLKMMPEGLQDFKLDDPPPKCMAWRQNMPKTREDGPYDIYMKARATWRSKREYELTRAEAVQIIHGVRQASEMGDWGARALMAKFYLRGFGVLESNRVLMPDPEKGVAIIRAAAALDQPWAVYDLGVAYEYGYGGLPQNGRIAWAYYLKAAKLGSPEGQMALADAYGNARHLENEESMRICAYGQGYGPAAYSLGINRSSVTDDFASAIEYFQNGVKFGDHDSAVALKLLFASGYWMGMGMDSKLKLKKLGVELDPERSRRYAVIGLALEINPDLKLPRLDQALPLPPVKLPSWDGNVDALKGDSTGTPAY